MADRRVWENADPLGQALHFMHMNGTFYCRSEFTAPWALELPPLPSCLMFHVVTAGAAWLDVANSPATHLRPGTLALVPHGAGHRLASALDVAPAALFDLPREEVSERYEILRYGGGGEPTTLICGAVRFDHPAAGDLVRLLPPVIVIDSWSDPELEWLRGTLQLIVAEARELRPGGETVITRLADVLVIQAIRSWIARDPSAQSGWLGALRDAQIGRAVAAVHREPGEAWTVDSLAREAGMSRSAFAARFTAAVGEPAMKYVARWRMNVASAWLSEERGPTLAQLAQRLGYESEAAFARAYRRVTGAWPGAARPRRGASASTS